MTGAAIARSIRTERADPHHLPVRYHVERSGDGVTEAEQAIYIDRRTVVVKRHLSGLPLTLSLPITAFEGVAVRVLAEGEDRLRATIELRHRDPALTLPLTTTLDMEEAALDWRNWSRQLSLPMLLIEPDGTARRMEADMADGPALPRRNRATLARRRPRFLMRRKPGASGPMPVIEGREIIAPE